MAAAKLAFEKYVAAANQGTNVHRELTGQLTFMLRSAVVGVGLMAELLPTLPKDEKYAARMDGLKKFNNGMVTMFSGAETSLSEKSFYSSEDLALLLDAMTETLPTIKQVFAPDYKLELRKKLESYRAAFPQPKDTANIQRMIDELRD